MKKAYSSVRLSEQLSEIRYILHPHPDNLLQAKGPGQLPDLQQTCLLENAFDLW